MRFGATCAAAIALSLCMAAGSATAERPADPSWEISALAGGGFGGSINISLIDGVSFADASIDLAPGWAYQAIIGLRLRSDEGNLIVVSYSRQRSAFELKGLGVPNVSTDIDMGVIQIGGEIDGKIAKHVKPFFGLGVGATHYSPLSSKLSTSWYFSGTVWGGLKFPITDHIGIRTQGRMIGTLISKNSNVFCTTGIGCVVSISDISGPISGDLMAGLYVAF
jgi:hypothetical protein